MKYLPRGYNFSPCGFAARGKICTRGVGISYLPFRLGRYGTYLLSIFSIDSKSKFLSSIQFEPIKYSASATNQSSQYPYYQGPNHVHPYEETRILPLASTVVVSANHCESDKKCAKNSDVSKNPFCQSHQLRNLAIA